MGDESASRPDGGGDPGASRPDGGGDPGASRPDGGRDPGASPPDAGDESVWTTNWELDVRGLRAARVGARAGARDLGASVYEIDPGGAISPYHTHHANEELLVVLSGTPSLRTPAGMRELAPGALVAFPTGAEGAHRVVNRSDEPARVLIVSTMRFPELAEHGDTGAWLLMTGIHEGKVFPAGTDVPVMEALANAMREARRIEAGPEV